MLEKIERPYEFLCRWTDGVLTGAHVGFITEILEDGKVLHRKTGEVMPVNVGNGYGFPLADILPHIQTGAIAQMEAANTECAVHKAECEKALKDAEAANADCAAHKAELEQAKAELEKANARIAELEAQNANNA